MQLQQILIHIRNNILPNVSQNQQTSDDRLIEVINQSLRTLHTILHVRVEQAIVRIGSSRTFFTFRKDDPDVILGSFSAMNKLQLLNATTNQNIELTFDNLKANDTTQGTLQILCAEDLKNTPYVMNEVNVFSTTQDTLYFPNAKEGDVIYVSHKPYPKYVSKEDMEEDLDLPDNLLDCLYALTASKVTTGIESFKEFHEKSLMDYNNKIQEVMLLGLTHQTNLASPPIQLKGFR